MERKAEGDLLAQVNDYTRFCVCRMTSCRNLFHHFLLSYPPFISLSLYPPSIFSIWMSSKLHQATRFFHSSPSFVSHPLSFFCFVSVFPRIDVKTEMFSPQIFSPVQKICTDKDLLLTALRQVISRPPSILLSVFVSISSLSFVKSLTVPALSFFTPCLSSSLHPPLPSVTHLSLPFTNQYAGQQAV